MRILPKVALTLVTFLFLASMGGGMLVAWPVLVPLHWIAARRAGPKETAWWGLLAGASMAEVLTMATYVVTGDGFHLLIVFLGSLVGVSVGFLAWHAQRAGLAGDRPS